MIHYDNYLNYTTWVDFQAKCAQSHDKLVSRLGYGSNWITWLY